MRTEDIRTRLKKNSKKDTTWIKSAKYRRDNKWWLDISFDIAVKAMSKLKSNKKLGLSPSNQKELADRINCSPQYINKVLKGKENLTLETIGKLADALDIALIYSPDFSSIDDINTTITELEVPRESWQILIDQWYEEMNNFTMDSNEEILAQNSYDFNEYTDSSKLETYDLKKAA